MKAEVTISRCSDGTIRLYIGDKASSIDFVEVSMTPEAFGNAITGLGCQEASMEVRGMQWVGKRRITEPRRIVSGIDSYDRAKQQAWLEANAQEEGWIVSTYLGSQRSITQVDGKTVLNYTVTKYVDEAAA